MLRNLLLVFALAVGLIGLGARLAGHKDAAPFAIWGCFIAAAVLIERHRYKARETGDSGWQATDERFIDPESGQPVQVFYNPRTGERRYGNPER